MALADYQPSTAPANRCGVYRLHLDDTDRAELNRWLDDPDLTAASIGRSLRAAGHLISDQVVEKHRRKACSCR